MAQVDDALQTTDDSEASSSSSSGGVGAPSASAADGAAGSGEKRSHPRAHGGAPTAAAMALMEDQRHVLMPMLAELTSAVAAKNWFLRGTELNGVKPTLFHSPDYLVPKMTIYAYLERMSSYMGCAGTCYVFALVIIDALMHKRGHDARFLIMPSSMHRLMLVSVVVAIKFLEDSFRSNRFYAKVGGVDVGEFNRIEKLLLFEIDYELTACAAHFGRYANRLYSIVTRSNTARQLFPLKPPLWHIHLRAFFVYAERRLLRAGSSNNLIMRLRAQNKRMAGTATALSGSPSASSVAALVGSPSGSRKTPLRASSAQAPVVQRTASGLIPTMKAAPAAASTTIATTSATGRAKRTGAGTLRSASSSSSPSASSSSSKHSPLHSAAQQTQQQQHQQASASATGAPQPPAPQHKSPVSLERQSRSPTSAIDSVAKLKRVHSTEITFQLFGMRAAPPARRTSSSPAQLGVVQPLGNSGRSKLALAYTHRVHFHRLKRAAGGRRRSADDQHLVLRSRHTRTRTMSHSPPLHHHTTAASEIDSDESGTNSDDGDGSF